VASDDAIELRGLRVAGIVGVLAHEQAQPQPLELDIDVHLDLSAAGTSDALADTVDYGELCGRAEHVVTSTRHTLLEALAGHVADDLLAADPRIERVTVALRKLRPPVAQQLTTSGVRVTRGR
jgi:dihydroneopterin aldolase